MGVYGPTPLEVQASMIKSLLALGSILFLVSIGCGKAENQEGKDPDAKPKPTSNAVPELKLTAQDLTADRTKSFPVFRLGKPLSFASNLLIQFKVDELKAHRSLGRELMIIPMENGIEIREEWPLEGPEPVGGDSIGDISLTRTKLDSAIQKCKNYSKLNERPNIFFMLRVIYSDSVRPSRTTLLVLEMPLG